MSLVALSAAYGAGGSRVGPALAERLGVPFVDRAIPVGVAAELAVPLDVAAAHDDQMSASWFKRMLSGFVGQTAGRQHRCRRRRSPPRSYAARPKRC
jgi:hypothetical protein